VRFSDVTTIRVGGEAHTVIDASTEAQLIAAAHEVWSGQEEWLVLGGGSNIVVADEGFDGTVIRVLSRGVERLESEPGTVRLRVQSGEPWDALVAHTVENGWAGIEALSGIPGSTGAAPIQNIGAYGRELSDVLVAADFLDYLDGDLTRLTGAELGLEYRNSAIKAGRRGIVIAVELLLTDTGDGLSAPIAYAQLASALGVELADRVPLRTVREAVLRIRASKGMVLDAADPDSVSCGSFFTNPIVGENFARTLPAAAPRWPMEADPEDAVAPLGEQPALPPQRSDHRVKLSAAWLIEQAGIGRGFRLPGSRAAISSKHTLAIVNTGGASADEIASLARYVHTRVFSEFGVRLQPEPNLVGLEV
jgi:UDP-N-acetylmuramate dehydrogenase